jgi:peptidoglycan/xylan/chitin deacetylase (PgdA/CDA1 family)
MLPSLFKYFKRRFKSALGRVIFGTGLHRRLLKDRAIIVCFHRIDDRLDGNPISITSQAFRRFCEFFARYFDVVPVSELVDRLKSGGDLSGLLAITFDDGYQDNFLTAAPELKRHKLPACFFVTTNYIESHAVPWWDAEEGITPEWMTWDEVRLMHRQGFEFGPHTQNHVDLGRVVGDEARREIAGAKARLDDELGIDATLFSYPYGRADQMCETNRDIVRDAGLGCCMSACRGIVTPETDPFDIPRMPISDWYLSPYQFGVAALMQLRRVPVPRHESRPVKKREVSHRDLARSSR